jgi:hypothetical protein
MPKRRPKTTKGKKPRKPSTNVPKTLAEEEKKFFDDFLAPIRALDSDAKIDEIVAKINARVQASDDARDEIREEDGADEEDDGA